MVIDACFGAATMTFEGIHVKTIGIFLISLALVAGMVGCVSSPNEYGLSITTHYYLTISGGEGGEVTTLGEGTFACSEGDVVTLVATPASGYRFVGWTGDLSGSDSSVTIVMDFDKTVTARFSCG